MDLRTARYLVAIAEHGSLTKAADVLYVTQPSLWRALRYLGSALGVALVERAGARLVPTAAGQRAAASARRALAELDRARHRVGAVTSLAAGRLYISTQSVHATGILARVAGRVHDAYPGI